MIPSNCWSCWQPPGLSKATGLCSSWNFAGCYVQFESISVNQRIKKNHNIDTKKISSISIILKLRQINFELEYIKHHKSCSCVVCNEVCCTKLQRSLSIKLLAKRETGVLCKKGDQVSCALLPLEEIYGKWPNLFTFYSGQASWMPTFQCLAKSLLSIHACADWCYIPCCRVSLSLIGPTNLYCDPLLVWTHLGPTLNTTAVLCHNSPTGSSLINTAANGVSYQLYQYFLCRSWQPHRSEISEKNVCNIAS